MNGSRNLLIIDELGFAKYSELFAGNQNEADVLSVIINSLEQHLEPQTDRTVVIDAKLIPFVTGGCKLLWRTWVRT